MPESRINPSQHKVITERYNPLIKKLNIEKELTVTVPRVPTVFCDMCRCKEITQEIAQSKAANLVLLGDIPVKQYLNRVVQDVGFTSLSEFQDKQGYGSSTPITIDGIRLNLYVFAHPRQVATLGNYSKYWNEKHRGWEQAMPNKQNARTQE